MTLNYKIFKSLIENFEFFENKPHIGVGVSGGPDSIALVYLLNKWTKYKKGKLTAIVFDHKIRNNSKNESIQVKKMLTDLDIYSLIIRPNKKKLIKKNMSNARDNRFEGLINFCKKKNILHLFLAHHFDDNLETYLMRKINGSNLDGLECINKIAYFKHIQILRPFIEINKKSILSFNKNNNLHFINDPSNQAIGYSQTRVYEDISNQRFDNIKQTVFSSGYRSFFDITPDLRFILGPDNKVKNLFHCLGSGQAFKFAPAFGEMMAEFVVKNGRLSELGKNFSISRFDTDFMKNFWKRVSGSEYGLETEGTSL